MNTIEKLNQAEALLHSLTGSTGTDELENSQVQSLLILCTQLVQDARASVAHVQAAPVELDEGGTLAEHAA